MIRNYFKIAWRNITGNKTYSVINIAGLSIGLASFLLIATVVINELSYDKTWSKSERTYRLLSENTALGELDESTNAPIAPQLAANFDQVETYSRIRRSNYDFNIENDPVSFDVLEVNPTIWDVLDFEILQGTPKEFVEGYPNLVISEKVLEQYFPDSHPVGQIIKDISNTGAATEYYISGVIENLPVNTHLRADMLVISEPRYTDFSSDFTPYAIQYIVLKPGISKSDFTVAANNWLQHLPNADKNMKIQLQPMEDIYLNSDGFSEDQRK